MSGQSKVPASALRVRAGTSRRNLLAATIFGAALSAGAPAAADSYSFDVIAINSPLITVASNIDEYTGLENGTPIQGTIKVDLDAGVSGRVKFWSAWPALGYQDNDTPLNVDAWGSYQTSGSSKSYSAPRPKKVNTNVQFTIEPAAYSWVMVAACENYADKLRSQGMSNTEIFSADRWIQVAIEAWGDYEMSGIEGSPYLPEVIGWDQYEKVNVICKGDPAELEPMAPAITAASLSVKVAQSTNTSACELQLDGFVISKDPNQEVKFRYVDDKGKQSELKTVTTSAQGAAEFVHSYPMNPKEKKSGKIRMVGFSPPFFSNWHDFEVDCVDAADDFKTVLPPKAFHLEAIATADEVMQQGLICPVSAKIYGILKGRGTASGAAALFAGGQLKALKQYSIEDGETIIVEGDYEFDWQAAGASQQNVKFAMNVSNKVGDLVDQIEKTQNFACRKPEVSGVGQGAAGGYSTGESGLKSTNLSVFATGKKVQNGYVCPAEVHVSGYVQSGADPFSGSVALFAGGSLKKQEAFEQEPNWGSNYGVKYTLDWSGPALPEQTVLFAMKVLNQHGVEVGSEEETESFACEKIATTGVANGAAGGYSTGKPKPTHSQQAGKPAAVGQVVLLPGANFAIQSPKGRLRQGQIKLSGGKPNAKYALRFYRKTESGFKRVRSAQLPRQMTGPTASFDLKALSGSRNWRLEVCPAGSKGKKACETSDFSLPLLKGAGKVKTPGKPTSTKVFILPGLGG